MISLPNGFLRTILRNSFSCEVKRKGATHHLSLSGERQSYITSWVSSNSLFRKSFFPCHFFTFPWSVLFLFRLWWVTVKYTHFECLQMQQVKERRELSIIFVHTHKIERFWEWVYFSDDINERLTTESKYCFLKRFSTSVGGSKSHHHSRELLKETKREKHEEYLKQTRNTEEMFVQ